MDDSTDDRKLDPTRYGRDWTKRFRELNATNAYEIPMLDEHDQPVEGTVKGTLVFARSGVTADGEEMGIGFQWAPEGELDPKNAIPIFGQVVHPNDVGMLLSGLMKALMCPTVFEQVMNLVNTHECDDEHLKH